MKMILILVQKDLRRRLADPSALLVSLAIPLVMVTLMALAFGGRGNQEENAPPLRLVIANADTGPIGRMVAGSTQNPEAAKRLEIRQASSRDRGLRLLRREGQAALVVIPKDFSKDLFEGRRVTLEIVKNPSQSIMPVVAQQGAEVVALYLSVGARLLRGQGANLQEIFGGDRWVDAARIAALAGDLYTRARGIGDLLLPPLVDVEVKKEQEVKGGGFDLIGWMFPGMVMMGLLFVSLTQMRDLLREASAGTMRRQLAAPLGAGRYLLAKIVSVAVVVALCEVALLLAGSLAFGLRWRGGLLPLAVASVFIVLAVTGFAGVIFSLARTERQGDTFGGIVVMLMSLLGGSLFPAEAMPAWMQSVSRLTISHWGNSVLRGIASGGGWGVIGGDLAVLAAIGGTLILLGTLALRRRHARGTL